MTQFKFHISTLLLLLFPLLNLMTWSQTAVLWLSAALHEFGHIFAFTACGAPPERVEVFPFGICALPGDTLKLTPKQEIFCAAAGPTVNLLIAAATAALPFSLSNETARYTLYCNLSLMILNLLPILPLDGGRILYYTLAKKQDAPFCEQVCRQSARILLAVMLYPVCKTCIFGKNFSLALIWIYLLIYSVIRKGAI